MGIVASIIVYIVLWWVVLFTILPWWVETPQGNTGANERGAPKNPYIKKKMIITSLIALVVWVAVYSIIESDIDWLDDLFMNTGY